MKRPQEQIIFSDLDKKIVTGSARLDIFRRGGDSLAGRYFLHCLYPFSVRELKGTTFSSSS